MKHVWADGSRSAPWLQPLKKIGGALQGGPLLVINGADNPYKWPYTSARAFSHQWTDLTSTQWHTDFTDLTSMGQISPHPDGTPQETKSDLANDARPISTIPLRFAIPEYKKVSCF